MSFWSNFCDAFKDTGEAFKEAGRSFSNGNVVGGLLSATLATAYGAENIVLLGLPHKLGNDFHNKLQAVTEGTVDENGLVQYNIKSGEGDIVTNTLGKFALHGSNNSIKQEYYENTGNIAAANGEAAILMGECAAIAAGGAAGAHMITGAALNAGIAAKGASDTAVIWATVKGSTKVIPGVIAGNAIFDGLVDTAGNALDKSLYDANDNNPDNDKTVWQHAKDVVFENAKDAATGTVNTTVDLVGDVADDATKRFFPGLAQFMNTVSAGCYATSIVVSRTSVGSYASAVCSKTADKFKSWIKQKEVGNANRSISEIAKEKANAASELDDKGWFDLYADKVSELDKEDDFDPSKRNLVQKFGDDSEPAIG